MNVTCKRIEPIWLKVTITGSESFLGIVTLDKNETSSQIVTYWGIGPNISIVTRAASETGNRIVTKKQIESKL